MGKLHLAGRQPFAGIPRHECNHLHASWSTTSKGEAVTCKSCRRTTVWKGLHRRATRLYEKVEHAACRGDWPRDRHRIERLMSAWPMFQAPPEALVALDRYEEQDPADRDPAALAMELAPVDPGWLW